MNIEPRPDIGEMIGVVSNADEPVEVIGNLVFHRDRSGDGGFYTVCWRGVSEYLTIQAEFVRYDAL